MIPKTNTSEENTLLRATRSKITALMTLCLSILTIFACLMGILKESTYNDLLPVGTITEILVVGSIAQDIIFIPLALTLTVLSILYLVRPGYKILISILGLTANFFYGYGLYVMQGQYTSIYLVYLVIFSLSIYSIILGLLSFTPELISKTILPKGIRIGISIFLFIIAFMLGFIWILRVSLDIAKHIPQDTYGVFVLDLAIVFPALAICAIKLIQGKQIGNILAGVALLKAFTVCLSWGFAELYGRLTGHIQGGYDMLAIPSVLTLISLVLFIVYMRKLRENYSSVKTVKSSSVNI